MTNEFELVTQEIALWALNNHFNTIAEHLDICDEDLIEIQERLNNELND